MQYDRLWTDDDLARFCNISKSKVRADRAAGRLPFPVIRLGRTVRYNPEDVMRTVAAK